MTIRVVRKQLLAVSQEYYPQSKNTMNIITFYIVMAAVLSVTLTACVAPDGKVEAPVRIQTSSGQVSAEIGPEGTLVYHDIPFAQPPVGALRWAAPEPVRAAAGGRFAMGCSRTAGNARQGYTDTANSRHVSAASEYGVGSRWR